MAAGALHCALGLPTAHWAVLCCSKSVTDEPQDSLTWRPMLVAALLLS